MKWTLALLLFSLVTPQYLRAQAATPALEAEMNRIDTLATDLDLKLAVVAAMADSLQVHRNHLLLIRREKGASFAAIFVSELRSQGKDEAAILHSLRVVRRKIERQLAPESITASAAARPVVLVGSKVDRNSAATVYPLLPEIGFDSKHVAAVVGLPYYRVSTSGVSAAGVGDAYVSGLLRGHVAGLELGSALTIGGPTGDKKKGLGAGKVTIDATGTIARRFQFAKPWISLGLANSVFANAGYQRPYITDGKAAHFAGGVDISLPLKFAVGIGGFGLLPVGNQVAYSMTVQAGSSNGAGGQMSPPSASGMMPGGGMGSGMGTGTDMTMPFGTSMPFYDHAQMSIVSADQLRDYGPSAWLSVPLHAGLSLNAMLARSVPFELTTVRLGIGIDVVRLLFPHKRFWARGCLGHTECAPRAGQRSRPVWPLSENKGHRRNDHGRRNALLVSEV